MGLIFLPICLLVTVRAQQRTQSTWGWGEPMQEISYTGDGVLDANRRQLCSP